MDPELVLLCVVLSIVALCVIMALLGLASLGCIIMMDYCYRHHNTINNDHANTIEIV